MGGQAKTRALEHGVVLNGKWEIVEHIATGGKGEVYRARQINLDREVVVKTLSREYLAELDGDHEYIETELQRFHREALAMAKVRHPYIVRVYDQDQSVVTVNGMEESIQYLVMEYINGPDLRSSMPSEGFCTSEQQAREWLREYFLPILDGVQSIHDLGIVHRDIKPENVLLEHNTPKIMDFGIAGGVRWSALTKSHHVEGTITYMAPEQFMDLGDTDVRGDVYALGKILYEAVVGKLDKKTASPLKSVCLPCVDTPFWKRLDLVVQEATMEDQDQRIPTAKAFKERLEKLLEDFDETKFHFMGVSIPRPNQRQKLIGIAAIVCIIGVIIASNLVHHVIMVKEEEQTASNAPSRTRGLVKSGPDIPAPVRVHVTQTHPFIVGKDGSTMRYVAGGEFTVPDLQGSKSGTLIRVGPFYMAETEVTNAQYVRFLNQTTDKIFVKNGAVKSNGHTWLILGNAFGGYEPIVYQDGEFSVKDPRYASFPVVRVTGFGAFAYARQYNENLPSEFQWYAAADGAEGVLENGPKLYSKSHRERTDLEQEMVGLVDLYGVLDKAGTESSNPEPGPSRIPHNVTRYPPNHHGIRGLRANVGEWGLQSSVRKSNIETKSGFVILGALDGTWLLGSTLVRGSEQSPSKAYVSVGFRIVVTAEAKPSGQEQGNERKK